MPKSGGRFSDDIMLSLSDQRRIVPRADANGLQHSLDRDHQAAALFRHDAPEAMICAGTKKGGPEPALDSVA